MDRSNPTKHFVLAFIIALVIYIFCYYAIENQRVKNGPWLVTFSATAVSAPALIINQESLRIANLKIEFTNASSAPTNFTWRVDHPVAVPFPVPFGKCVFEDILFEPGTVALKLYGHEIQLMPRTLTIDKKEYPWQSGQTISLKAF